MGFLEELRGYLEYVDQSGRADSKALKKLDPGFARAELLKALEDLEKRDPSPEGSKRREGLFNAWNHSDKVQQFAEILSVLLQESFLRGASRKNIEAHVRIGLRRRLGLNDALASQIRTLELDRLAEQAWSTWSLPARLTRNEEIVSYAREIRAVRRAGEDVELSPIGRVFLGLTGRDAIQWLLSVEIVQSTGPKDDWRMARETAVALLKKPKLVGDNTAWAMIGFPHSWSALKRMGALGLLTVVDNEESDESGYELLDLGTRILQEVSAPRQTPFSVLAATLSQDEALTALDSGGNATLRQLDRAASASAFSRQARLVAHEIRNALMPAQVALGSFYDELVGAESAVAKYRPRIDPAIAHVFRFVEELVKTAELASIPPERFDAIPVVRDAIAVTASPGLRLTLRAGDLPPVLGCRDRLTLALVNMIRNAEQAGAKHVTIDLRHDSINQSVAVTVDDDGPGVPEQHREAIFRRGFTLRPNGTGEGLALVKEVIEVEMKGRVLCTSNPAGQGARFVIRLPARDGSFG